MGNYILLLVSVILGAGNLAANRLYQKKMGVSLWAGMNYMVFYGIFSSLVFWAVKGFRLQVSAYSLAMAGLMALLSTGYTLIGFLLMKEEKMTLYTLFLMTGGMTVPYLWGLFGLDESFSYARTAGLIMIAAAICLSNSGKGVHKEGRKPTFLCGAVFLLNGLVSVISKEHQISAAAVPSTDFVLLSNLARIVFCLPLLGTAGKKGAGHPALSFRAIWLVLLATLLGSVSYWLQLIGAKSLPATVLYPIVTGGTIVFGALFGQCFFKEKLTRRMRMALLLCCIGTCLFL